ncbi:MAG: hypothetical protein AB7K35_16000 [Pseudorhodoplanes sp.]
MRTLFLSRLRPEMRHTFIVCCALGLFLAVTTAVGVTIRMVGSGSGHISGGIAQAPILFVPERGNVCKQRMLNNSDWTISEGGYIVCDDEVSWNVGLPANRYSAESRIDAVRSGFTRK